MIPQGRLFRLNAAPETSARYVLYWMQAAQRARFNHALEYAVTLANDARVPLAAVFALVDDYPGANLRHYDFMIDGLIETTRALANRGIGMAICRENPETLIPRLAQNAAAVVTDDGYTRIQKRWRTVVAENCDVPVHLVSTNVVVPVEVASNKEEYGAYTLRPKIHRLLPQYLLPLSLRNVGSDSLALRLDADPLPHDKNAILDSLTFNTTVSPAPGFVGGTNAGMMRLRQFIENALPRYESEGNDPTKNAESELSPYLHFGQISPVETAIHIGLSGQSPAESYLEQLIVRRELAMNFTFYNPAYDSLACLPDWATATLNDHRNDRREFVYELEQWEQAQTHDPYWNAAQNQMMRTGKMHGYMRMYWGKKLLEWTRTPERAFEIAVALNDKYELDGRDPNGYAGIAWCFGKHDRPWKERAIFGKVRYMNAAGLRRKFDIDRYTEKYR